MDPALELQPTNLTDKVLYEKRRREFENNEAKWLRAVEFHGKGAIDAFMKILKFPDGGWLRGCSNPGDEDEEFRINAVRRIIVKKVCFLN